MLKLLILKASWLSLPIAALLALVAFRYTGWKRWSAAALLTGTAMFIWGRHVEPQQLTVHRESILLPGASKDSPAIRIALFSDTHLGMFSNAMPMNRIVKRINAEAVDAVFLAGDITYYPAEDQIAPLLAPLSELHAQLYVVLGNHDIGFPGRDLSRPIFAALEMADATNVQNRAHEVTLGGQEVIVAGASDLWQKRQDFGFSADLPAGVPVILLTHNPDTAMSVPADFDYDLMLAGHTHGGQIRIPSVYKRMIPTRWPFDKELHVFPSGSGDRLVYVTTGTGMVGLPIRFLMPPRVNILTICLPESERPDR